MPKAAETTSPARAATLHLGGDAFAHPDLGPLIRPLNDRAGAPVIRRHPNNPRMGDHDAIVKSIQNNGVYSPMKAQRSTGYVLAGNHTLDAILDQGGTSAPWVWLDVDDDEARRIMLDDNHVGDLGGYDDRMLLESLRAAEAAGDLLLSSYTADDVNLYATLADVLIDPTGQVDPTSEFRAAGVDDYANQDGTAAFSAHVSFKTMADYEEFRTRLGLVGPRRARGIWFPEQPDLMESPIEHVATGPTGA